MGRKSLQEFSRRERQIMDVIWRRGECTAAEVMEELPDAPSYSTVRTLLGVLERKGHLGHVRRGYHYVYSPTMAKERASASMLKHLMNTFFEGSPTNVVSAVLDISDSDLSDDEYQQILQMVEEARKEGR